MRLEEKRVEKEMLMTQRRTRSSRGNEGKMKEGKTAEDEREVLRRGRRNKGREEGRKTGAMEEEKKAEMLEVINRSA